MLCSLLLLYSLYFMLWQVDFQFPPLSTRWQCVVFVFSLDRYMVTSGMDKKLKIYDIRAFKPLKSYFLPAGASCLSLSQRGLLSAATGDVVQVSCHWITVHIWRGFLFWTHSSIYLHDKQKCDFSKAECWIVYLPRGKYHISAHGRLFYILVTSTCMSVQKTPHLCAGVQGRVEQSSD